MQRLWSVAGVQPDLFQAFFQQIQIISFISITIKWKLVDRKYMCSLKVQPGAPGLAEREGMN